MKPVLSCSSATGWRVLVVSAALVLTGCTSGIDETAAVAPATACPEVVVEDDYGDQVLVSSCEQPSLEPTATVAEVTKSLDRHTHDVAVSMKDFVGTPEALRLTQAIRSRFIALEGCGESVDDESILALVSQVPDAEIRTLFEDAMRAFEPDPAICQDAGTEWFANYLVGIAALEQAALKTDRGLAGSPVPPSAADAAVTPERLTRHAVVVYERLFWALRGVDAKAGSDLWMQYQQVAIGQQALAHPADLAALDAAMFGSSVVAHGVEPGILAATTGQRIGNFAVGRASTDFVLPWIDYLHQRSSLPASGIWALSTAELIGSCPSEEVTLADLQVGTAAFAGSAAFDGLDWAERILSPEGLAVDSPRQAYVSTSFSAWPDVPSARHTPPTISWTNDDDELAAVLATLATNDLCADWFAVFDAMASRFATPNEFAIVIYPSPSWLDAVHDAGSAGHDAVAANVERFAAERGFRFARLDWSGGDLDYWDARGHFNTTGRVAFTHSLANVIADW